MVAREEVPGEKRLVGYVVAARGQSIDQSAVRQQLGQRLPDYMVPAAIVELEVLPLTPNGKLDRRALPAPKWDANARGGYEPPEREIERKLAEIWEEVLGVERVGRRDNFFELGGHSLLGVKMIERMRREGLATEVRTLFREPTLEGLARAIEGVREAELEVPPNLIPEGCGRSRRRCCRWWR